MLDVGLVCVLGVSTHALAVELLTQTKERMLGYWLEDLWPSQRTCLNVLRASDACFLLLVGICLYRLCN